MAGAKHFEELDCWKLAHEFRRRLLSICSRPGVANDFEFVSQLKTAARSAPTNIAEGFGRRTHREFARYLDIARGSLTECQNHLRDALDAGHITHAEFNDLLVLAKRAGGAVAGLQRYLRDSPER